MNMPITGHHSCKNGESPTVRREWRQLSRQERINYLFAVQCLRNLPSRFFPEQRYIGRYMDFVYAHFENRFGMHDAAGLLPWHRWLLALFERSLRLECSYKGPMPYWDWTQDWERPEESPVFDELYGLGGNGDPRWNSTMNDGWCVHNGPFADTTIPVFKKTTYGDEHCLSRKFEWRQNYTGEFLQSETVRRVLQERTFWNFTRVLERGCHNAVHWYIGGVLPTLYSPADPVFYLHHAQIDRLWAIWQNSAPNDASDYGGYYTQTLEAPAAKGDIVTSIGLAMNVTVEEILDIGGDVLCYQYDNYEI